MTCSKAERHADQRCALVAVQSQRVAAAVRERESDVASKDSRCRAIELYLKQSVSETQSALVARRSGRSFFGWRFPISRSHRLLIGLALLDRFLVISLGESYEPAPQHIAGQNAVAVERPNCALYFTDLCCQLTSRLESPASRSWLAASFSSDCFSCVFIYTLSERFDFVLIMAGLPMRLVARNVPLRTVRRWCAEGKIYGAYQTKGGHWRIRRLPPDKVEIVIKLQCAIILLHVQRMFPPWLNVVLESNCAALDGLTLELQPEHLSKPDEIRLLLRATTLQRRGDEVNRENLADAFGVSVPTLYDRYGRELVSEVCRPDCKPWQMWEVGRKPARKKSTKNWQQNVNEDLVN